jgi:hypothetical protein
MPGRFLLLCSIACCFSYCNNGTIHPYSNCQPAQGAVVPLSITHRDTLRFYLDSLMVLSISTPVDYHEHEKRLYVYDSYNNRLLDYPVGDTTEVVHAERIHQVKVKKKISYIRYFSPDSLVMYAYNGAEVLYYNMAHDRLYRRMDFVHQLKGKYAAPPYARATSPLLFSDNSIAGFGFLMGETERDDPGNRTICSVMDLRTGKVRYRIPYSRLYWEHNWGGAHMRTPYTTYNGQTKQHLLSLPADHHVQLIDSNWQVKDIPAATRKKICITSMGLSKGNKQVSDAEYAWQYFSGTPSYRNIIYDSYHERYYRILELPPVAPGKVKGKDASLIAFDKNFRYLGEGPLPASFALDNFFLTNKGIYFLNTANKDQNIAEYVQCKIE